MIALQTANEPTRLTTTDEVFHKLRSEIISLHLPPGSKISEVEIAKACAVSRQPVREAFMRLGALNLLEIRPQRATRVRKISHQDLRDTRFIRAAIEVEVVRVACGGATQSSLDLIGENLGQQRLAVAALDAELLHDLDYQFHHLICMAADRAYAFKSISENKTHTDRVCMLELSDAVGMSEVLGGHIGIFEALCAGDEDAAVVATRLHLQHLDGILARVSQNHPDFFED